MGSENRIEGIPSEVRLERANGRRRDRSRSGQRAAKPRRPAPPPPAEGETKEDRLDALA